MTGISLAARRVIHQQKGDIQRLRIELERQGSLNPQRFCVAMRLGGWEGRPSNRNGCVFLCLGSKQKNISPKTFNFAKTGL